MTQGDKVTFEGRLGTIESTFMYKGKGYVVVSFVSSHRPDGFVDATGQFPDDLFILRISQLEARDAK